MKNSILLIVILAVMLAGCSNSNILSYDREVLNPLMSKTYSHDTVPPVGTLEESDHHPLSYATKVISLLAQAHKSDSKENRQRAAEYLNYLADEYPYLAEVEDAIIWRYPFAWRELEAGWWSGMANAGMALAYLVGYQELGIERYYDIAQKAMKGAVMNVEDGGSALYGPGDTCWIAEYAHEGLAEDNVYRVLNGFLYSMLIVGIFQNSVEDEVLRRYYQDVYDCARRALSKVERNYLYPGGEWTYYMLNPLTINPVHYVIFEIQLYDALCKLVSDVAFCEEAEQRRSILKSHYPLMVSYEGLELKYLFSAMGPPHPYWIDTNQIILRFYDVMGAFLVEDDIQQPRNLAIDVRERAFLTGKIPMNAFSYRVYGKNQKPYETMLYEGRVSDVVVDAKEVTYEERTVRIRCAYDASCEESWGSIYVDPDVMAIADDVDHYANVQGRIVLDLLSGIRKLNYIGILLEPDADIHKVSIAVFDEDGNHVSRYYVPLNAGESNLILLSLLGFMGVESFGDEIHQIQLTVYTSDMDTSCRIMLRGVYSFEDIRGVYDFFNEHVFYFPEQP